MKAYHLWCLCLLMACGGEGEVTSPLEGTGTPTEVPMPSSTPVRKPADLPPECGGALGKFKAGQGAADAKKGLSQLNEAEPILRKCEMYVWLAYLELARYQAHRALGAELAALNAIRRGQAWVDAAGPAAGSVALHLDYAEVEFRHDLGDLSDAEQGYLELLPRAEKANDTIMVQNLHLALGAFLGDLGEWEEAEEHFRTMIPLADTPGDYQDSNHAPVGRAELSNALMKQGKLAEARRTMDEALALLGANRDLGRQVKLVIRDHAELLVAEGELEQARVLFSSIVNDPTAEAEARWRSRQGLADVLARQGRYGEARRVWWHAVREVERQHAMLSPNFYRLTSLGQRSGLYQGWIEGLVQGWEDGGKLAGQEGKFNPDRVYTRGPVTGDDVLAAVELMSSQLLSEQLLADRGDVSYDSGEYRAGTLSALPNRLIAGSELRQRLGPDQVVYILVPLVRSSLLLRVEQAGVEVFPLEVGGEALAKQVDRVVSGLNFREKALEPELERLGESLLGPVSWPEDVDTPVAFIALGEFDKVPLATLRVGGRYVVERCAPYYAPSLRALTLRRDRPSTITRGERALAVTFGEDLPWAGVEASLLGRAGYATRVLDGTRATRAEVLRGMTTADLVHIATHGVGPLRTTSGQVPGELSLADGRLSARDIQSLRLDAELVVFGACESGLGVRHMWETAWGSLQRAALEAKARVVMASRWKAHDEVSFLLMEQFYAKLKERGAAVALAHAQRLLLHREGASTRYPFRGLKLIVKQPVVNLYEPTEMPYASPSGWGAFSLVGGVEGGEL